MEETDYSPAFDASAPRVPGPDAHASDVPESPAPAGVGPWPGGASAWPDDDRYDPELLAHGDRRNVEDRYRYWTMDAIRADMAQHSTGLHVAIENVEHDFNIGSIVRTANALGARRVWIVGRKRWNRRGAMVTDRYLDVVHVEGCDELAQQCAEQNITLIGIDNVDGSRPLEDAALPVNACLVFGAERGGLSDQMRQACSQILHITQYGSTRSMNVGHAAAIAMWAWVVRTKRSV